MSTALAICGFGALGGFGSEPQALADAIHTGQTARQTLTIATTTYPAYLPDLEEPSRRLALSGLRRTDRFSRMAILVGRLALQDARLSAAPNRTGVIITTGTGTHETMFRFHDSARQHGDAGASPLLFSNSGHSGVLAHLTIHLGLTGPSMVICQPWHAFPAGLLAAQQWLAENRVDAVLLVSQDECHPVIQSGFHEAFGAQAQGPLAPFAWNRQSAMLAEGSAAFVLTRADAASAYPLPQLTPTTFPGATAVSSFPADDLLIVDAKGMAHMHPHYHPLAAHPRCISFAPAFGSLGTGLAMSLAGLLSLWRTGQSVHPHCCAVGASIAASRSASLLEFSFAGTAAALRIGSN